MPMTTDLPVGDLYEFIGDFRLNGDGPPTTGRMGLARLQEILLSSTSPVGALLANITGRLTTAEGFTNQITGLASRVTTLEGLAGISPGTDLAADGTAVRTTRYWGRPGEALRTWTASIAATPAAAVPLVTGGAYSVVATTMGPALRITGAAAARPIAQVPLDDTQVEEFRATIKRGADDTTTPANPANNAPVFAFACFKADSTDNGTVALPTDPLTAAQGFKTFTFRASLVAGLGTVDLPAGTRRVNLIPGGKGNGSIDVVSVERGSQALTAAPLITTLGDTDYVATVSADRKTSSLITFAAFKDLIMEKKIFKPARGTVPAAGALWMSPDMTRNSARFINNGASGNVLLGVGKAPVAGTDYTIAFGPGATVDLDRETGAIYMATDSGADIPIYGGFTNQSGFDARGDAVAYAYISRLTGNQTEAERNIIVQFIKDLNTADALGPLRMMYLLAHTDTVSSRVDVVRPGVSLQLGATAPTWQKYIGYTGDGLAAYADTQYFPKDDTAISFSKHGFGVYVMNNNQNATNKYSLGNPTASICANRTGITASTRSGFTPSNKFTTVDSYGGLFAVARQVAGNYDIVHNQNKYNEPTAGTTWGTISYSMYLFAVNQAGGAAGFTADTIGLCYADNGMPPEKHMAIATAFAKYRAAMAAL